jgi:hypothetical protein
VHAKGGKQGGLEERRSEPRLFPGYGGDLTHGLLRVTHVVRTFPASDQPLDLARRGPVRAGRIQTLER